MTQLPEHGHRIFVNSQEQPEYRYRGECLCGWGGEDDKRGARYYASERAAKIGLSMHVKLLAQSGPDNERTNDMGGTSHDASPSTTESEGTTTTVETPDSTTTVETTSTDDSSDGTASTEAETPDEATTEAPASDGDSGDSAADKE